LLGLAAERALGFSAVVPLLESLSEATGESANLVVRDHDMGLVVLRVESRHPLRFSQPAGTRIPLPCTSSGKVLLAFAAEPGALLESLGELPRLTDRTVTSRRALMRDLREIRAQGFALNEGERHPGVSGAAAPVFGEVGEVVAALAVQGPEVRMPRDRLTELGELVARVAAEVAGVLPAGSRP
jgi:IclR family acetate operon transcriptional repressor